MVEKIRVFLQKTLLPILRKKREFESKIHMSVEKQISARYVLLTLICGIVVFAPIGHILYHSELEQLRIIFHYKEREYDLILTDIYKMAVVMYLAGMFIVTELSKRNIHRLTEYMKDIIKSTNRITINNLENERLNVEGTQNELKEIATTINSMLDRLELSYETQKQFVSDASHELRTPIAVVKGYINMLDRWGAKDAEILEESVEAIKNEAKSMQELVEKLLFLSRHDKKTLKLKKKNFDVGKLIGEMLKEGRIMVQDKSIESLDINSVMLYGDQQTIKEAVRVLFENAVKYTEKGDTIYLGCEREGEKCIITIADTGLGMDEKDMDNVFHRFYRSDHVRNGKVSGHGLGLSIAKLIVLKHAGTIQVKSQYTKGTCFRIVLPIKSY